MTELSRRKILKFRNSTQEQLTIEYHMAALRGQLDIVRYLLTSSDLKFHADIRYGQYYGFRYACRNGRLNVIQYLLTSPKLKNHVDIHANDDEGFKFACFGHYWEIVHYLLSFTGERYIKFQETEYNLEWAMNNHYHDVVKSMIKSLYKNDMMIYVENLSKVEQYCQEHGLNFVEWQDDIIKDEIGSNSYAEESAIIIL